jgi:hypothetical protein
MYMFFCHPVVFEALGVGGGVGDSRGWGMVRWMGENDSPPRDSVIILKATTS